MIRSLFLSLLLKYDIPPSEDVSFSGFKPDLFFRKLKRDLALDLSLNLMFG
jgi:hypothetical protein